MLANLQSLAEQLAPSTYAHVPSVPFNNTQVVASPLYSVHDPSVVVQPAPVVIHPDNQALQAESVVN